MPIRYCSLSDEQIENAKTEENFLFELTVVTNDGKAEKYTYYKNPLSPGYAIREEAVGTFEDGNYNFEPSNVIFDTTSRHIETIISALKKLKNGEILKPDNEM